MQDFRPGQPSQRPSPAPSPDLSLLPEPASQVDNTSDYRQAYQATSLEDDLFEDEEVLVLASPWRRIGARLLDMLPFALIGVIAAIVVPFVKDNQTAVNISMLFMGLSFLALTVYQLVIMSRDGQTIGKKLLGIRVATLEGENPGFVKYVLLREFVYAFVMQIIGLIPFLGLLVTFGAAIACLIMLFLEESDRRTLQDMLASTLVLRV